MERAKFGLSGRLHLGGNGFAQIGLARWANDGCHEVKLPPQDRKSEQNRSQSSAPANRLDQGLDEGRPFAEIRRSVLSVLGILLLHRWAFFIPFCLISSAAFIVSLYYPRTYNASTSFERRNDPVMSDLPLSAGAASSFAYFRSTMHTELTSIATMAEVVDNLGMTKNLERNADGGLVDASLRQRNSMARTLGSTLTVTRSSPTDQLDILSMTYTGPDPSLGKRLVDEVKKVYIRRTIAWMHEFLIRQRDYFLSESSAAQAELQAAQREETKLRLRNPYANPSDPTAITSRLAQLEMERRELQLRRREYDTELDAQRQMLATLEAQTEVPAPTSNRPIAPRALLNPEVIRLRKQLDDTLKEIESLRSERGMTDAHPDIQDRLDKIRRTHSAIEEAQSPYAETSHSGSDESQPTREETVSASLPGIWHAERARIQIQIASQEAKIAEVDISLQFSEQAIAELTDAKDRVFELQEEYGEVQARLSKARHKYSSLEQTILSIEPAINAVAQDRFMQFSEGQPARATSIPVSPKAKTIVVLAILAGLAAGTLCLILVEVFDHVFRSSTQVQRSLGLPILEAIDEIVTVQDRRRLAIRSLVLAPLFALCLIVATGLTGSMAFLSIEKPWTYQSLRRIPRAAAGLFSTHPQNPPPTPTPQVP
ncbi:MAG: hypothetical protein AABZ47_12330 [Planctomycetota bacterium]